jgi:hypothetical protein
LALKVVTGPKFANPGFSVRTKINVRGTAQHFNNPMLSQ